ncbi:MULTISPECIES: SLATT domain-containing protein [Pseudomonas]|uniref:SLATT domain-containing protein n=1 Tax=Pseudomonas emilianonis TaxID=2915812 RepID=A0ABT0EGQ5_9PSED|nr:SLATT domain-containing protein [Pseudomonas emilianonis]MCK1784906.1 SLATT domain-containing protein [Pseudomonas emilianonis]
MSAEDTNCDALRQMISKTVAARFQASRRLDFHNKLSLFSISLFSIILILVALLQLVEFDFSFGSVAVNIGQVFLSIVILCFSIAISMSDFSLKSSKHHECGVQLNELVYKLMNKWGVTLSDQEYEQRLSEYFNILSKFENHTETDNSRVNKRTEYVEGTDFRYYSGFSLYFLLIFVSLGWFFVLIAKAVLR